MHLLKAMTGHRHEKGLQSSAQTVRQGLLASADLQSRAF